MADQQQTQAPVQSPAPTTGVTGPGAATGGGSGNAAAQDRLALTDATAAPTDALTSLRTAAEGSWYGDVDETECLRLITCLTPTERTTAGADTELLADLAGAFNQVEMATAVDGLRLALKWKVYWLERAGDLATVPPATWTAMFAAASVQEILEFIGWSELFGRAISAAMAPVLSALLTTLANPVRLLEIIAGPTRSDADVSAGLAHLEADAAGWTAFTTSLPQGSALTAEQRRAMARLVITGNPTVAHAMELFKIRFATRIENTTGSWTLANIRVVWAQLDLLPDEHVSDNTILDVFNATSGGGGMQGGDYIEIGEDGTDPAAMSHTVRHEIGHTVHDGPMKSTVDAWLQNGIKMWFYSKDAAGMRSWVNDLGGFPAEYTPAGGAATPFGVTEQNRAIAMLLEYVGPGNAWDPARATVDDPAVATDAAIWAAMPAGVQNAVTQSVSNWYTNHANFQSGAKGKYFLNYWYQTPFYMSPAAEAIVNATEDYASMSHYELFADAYAEYFKEAAGYTDPTR